MNKVGIIVPFYNHWDLCHARLFEFYRLLPQEDVEIILVDDASEDIEEIQGGISWWQKDTKHHKIRYYRTPENCGFGGAMNIGAKIAMRNGAEILIFHSNDVKIFGDVVTPVIDIINKNENVLIGNELINYPAGWNEFEIRGKKILIPWLNGYWLACSSKIWKMLGGFDPIYGKHDYEDVDISTKALIIGLTLVPLNSPLIKHLGTQTIGYTAERLAITTKNREKYLQKWSDKLLEICGK